jgi:ubiquinone/menaquinone biosynthesis C-methylase UbiE
VISANRRKFFSLAAAVLSVINPLGGVLRAATKGAQQPASAPQKAGRPMQHRFENPAEWAKRFDDPKRDDWQKPDLVVSLLAAKPGEVVADIGAGTGYFAVRLAKAQPMATVYGVDIEPDMVEYLRKRSSSEGLPNMVGVVGSAESAQLPQPVDLALIVDTYHHLPNRLAYFRDLRRSLKPGARVAIIDHRKDALEGPPAQFRLTLSEIEAEMQVAGYRLVERHDVLSRQHFLIFRPTN